MRDGVLGAAAMSRRRLLRGGLTFAAAAATAEAFPLAEGVAVASPATSGRIPVLPVLNVQVFGAAGDGVADDTAALQRAIDSVGTGATVWLPPGRYRLTNSLTVTKPRTWLAGNGTLFADFDNGAMLRFINVSGCGLENSLFFDGAWAQGIIGLQLIGSLQGSYAFQGDRLRLGIDVRATGPATQNSALNDLWVSIANGVRGVTFEGDGTHFASDNRIHRFDWWGVNSETSVGVDFVAYADNNTFDHGYLMLNSTGSVGVVYNSASPRSDVAVYENHLNCIVESDTPRTIAVQGNRTHGALGAWTSFLRLRLSGSQPPQLQVAPDCDIRLINSNMGTGKLIVGQPTIPAIWLPAQTPTPAAGACAPGACPSVPVDRLPMTFSSLVPPDWRRYDVTPYWHATGEGVSHLPLGLDLSQPDVGGDVAVSQSYEATLRSGTAGKLVTTDLAADIPATGPVMWASLYHLAGAHDIPISIIGLRLTRTL